MGARDGSAKARTRVVVVESPAHRMRPVVESLRELSQLDVVTTPSPMVQDVELRLEATHALALVMFLDIDDARTVEAFQRRPPLPLVGVVGGEDDETAKFVRDDIFVGKLRESGGAADLPALVKAIEARAAQTLGEERRRIWLAAAPPYAEHPDAPKSSRPVVQPPDLGNEVAFRAKHRHLATPWLGRPVTLRDPDAPPPPVDADPADFAPLLRLSMLESIGEPGGPSTEFAMNALKGADTRSAVLDVVGAILASPGCRGRRQPELRGHCAKALLRVGEVDRAEALLEDIADPDARILAADIAHARGREDEALQTVAATAGVRLETLGLIERIARWRDAVHDNPRRVRSIVPVRIDGVAWTIVFDATALLGRTDAAIVVRAPVVSRRHLLFRVGGEGPEVVDVGSQHGSFVDGARLIGPRPIDGALEIRLANSIACDVRPSGDGVVASGGVVVRIADEQWLLTFGRAATVGRFTLEWKAGVLAARAGEPFLVEPAGTTRTEVRFAPGMKLVDDRGGGRVALDVEDDAFEP